jgi:hypothetical protein
MWISKLGRIAVLNVNGREIWSGGGREMGRSDQKEEAELITKQR